MTLLYALPVSLLVAAKLARRRPHVLVSRFDTVSTFHSTRAKQRTRDHEQALAAASELLE